MSAINDELQRMLRLAAEPLPPAYEQFERAAWLLRMPEESPEEAHRRRFGCPKRFSPEFASLLQRRVSRYRAEISYDSQRENEKRANCEYIGFGFAPGWVFHQTPDPIKPV